MDRHHYWFQSPCIPIALIGRLFASEAKPVLETEILEDEREMAGKFHSSEPGGGALLQDPFYPLITFQLQILREEIQS